MRPNTLKNLRTAARGALLASLVLAPLIFWTATADLFNLVKITILWVAGVIALGFGSMWLAERRAIPKPRVAYAMAALALALVIATIFATNQSVSFIGIYHRYNGLVPHLLYIALALAVIGLYWEKPDDLRQVLGATAVSATLVSLYVILQELGFELVKTTDINGQPSAHPDGTLGNSNFAGGFLGLSAPVFLYLALSSAGRVGRRVWISLLAVDLVAVWFTQSRGGMLAAIFSLLAMALCYREQLPHWARIGAVATIGAVVLVAVLVAWHPGTTKPIPPLDKVEALSTETLGERGNYWAAAGKMFLDSPVVGLGPASYFENYPKYRTTDDARSLGLFETDSAHNIFFEYASDAGILGAGAFVAVVGLALVYGYRSARVLTRSRKLLVTTFFAVLVGYLTQGFFSVDVPPLAAMGWIAVGGVAAMADPGVMAARSRERPERRGQRKPVPEAAAKPRGGGAKRKNIPAPGPRWLIDLPIMAVIAFLLLVGVRPLIADVIAREGQKGASDPTAATQHYKDAISWHPFEPAYRNFLGTFQANQVDQASTQDEKKLLIQQAISSHKKSLELRPGNIYYIHNIAHAYKKWADQDTAKFPDADRWYRKAVAHDPKNWEVHMKYAELLEDWGDKANDPAIRQKALREFETATKSTNPKSAEAWVGLGKVRKALGDDAGANQAWERALKLDPKNKEAQGLLNPPKATPAPAPPAPVPAAPGP
jgi:hypothetical protein